MQRVPARGAAPCDDRGRLRGVGAATPSGATTRPRWRCGTRRRRASPTATRSSGTATDYYFRSIPASRGRVLTHGVVDNSPLQFTETARQREEWLDDVHKENWKALAEGTHERWPRRQRARRRSPPTGNRPTPMDAHSIPSHPVLTTEQAGALRGRLFGGDERRSGGPWSAPGRSIAEAIVARFRGDRRLPGCRAHPGPRGKGKQRRRRPHRRPRDPRAHSPARPATSCSPLAPGKLKPLAARAWRGLSESGRGRVRLRDADRPRAAYDLCLDGIFGYQYRPPLPPEALAAIAAADRCAIRFRAAVDLPSGLAAKGAFRADFTYATGIVKSPLLGLRQRRAPALPRPRFFRRRRGGRPQGRGPRHPPLDPRSARRAEAGLRRQAEPGPSRHRRRDPTTCRAPC